MWRCDKCDEAMNQEMKNQVTPSIVLNNRIKEIRHY